MMVFHVVGLLMCWILSSLLLMVTVESDVCPYLLDGTPSGNSDTSVPGGSGNRSGIRGNWNIKVLAEKKSRIPIGNLKGIYQIFEYCIIQ